MSTRRFFLNEPKRALSRRSDAHVVMIVQARMSSTRLPGKVLKTVGERPLLSYMIERLKRVSLADLVIATSNDPSDDVIQELCAKEGIAAFRGPLENVLERYYNAAHANRADVVVRLTADCPLIDPEIIDQMIATYLQEEEPLDYLSNVVVRTFPRGMDCEILSKSALEKCHFLAHDLLDREHVTRYILAHPELFTIGSFEEKNGLDQYRLTVDTIEDFQLIEHIFQELYSKKKDFTLKEIVALMEKHPEWVRINSKQR